MLLGRSAQKFLILIGLFLLLPYLLSSLLSSIGFTYLNQAVIIQTLADSEVAESEKFETSTDLAKYSQFFQNTSSASRLSALAMFYQGNEQESLLYWHDVDNNVIEILDRGRTAERNHQPQLALKWYQLASNISPELMDVHYNIANIYKELEFFPESAASYLIALEKGESLDVGVSDVYLQLTELKRLEQAEAEELIQLLNNAVESDSFSNDFRRMRAYYLRGISYKNIKAYRNAEEDLLKVLEMNPSHFWAHIHLGAIVWEYDGDLEKSLAYLNKAMEIEPDLKWSYRNIGLAFEENNQPCKALTMYQKVIEIDPNDKIIAEKISSIKNDSIICDS